MMLCGAARVAHPQRSVLIGAAKGSASATCYMKVPSWTAGMFFFCLVLAC